jgi:hypothetical protein
MDENLTVKDSINEEELLTICLEICANDPLMFVDKGSIREATYDEQEFERDAFFFASKAIVWYIMIKGDSMTEDEVQDRFMEMVVDHILTKEVKKGNIDAHFDNDGEIRYSISKQGKKEIFPNNSFMKNMQDKAKKKDQQ